MFFKKTVPFLITLIIGTYTFLYYFIPHPFMQTLWENLSQWAIIISGGALAVGSVSMIRAYWNKARNKQNPNRYYAMVTIVCMFTMVLIGFMKGDSTGIKTGSLFNDIYINVMAPLNSTMFSLLAFYMASAAFRSFRLKSFSAGLLLFTAIFVMLSQIPLGEKLSPSIPLMAGWLLDNPNVAAQRAIQIGVSIGVVATALKIILGIDKSVFSGTK